MAPVSGERCLSESPVKLQLVHLLSSTRVNIRWRAILLILLGSLCIVLSLTSPGTASTRGTRPTAPRQVMVVAGNASATVKFLPPTSNGGYKISDYRVDTHPSNQIHVCTSRTCRISGLTNGTTYFFTVDAVNKIGAGPYSTPSNNVTPSAPPVTVTFNANGGSGTMAPQTENYNVSADLTPNAFTLPGYTFTGWNTAANGGGTNYADDATYAFTTSVTLYAQWIAPPSAANNSPNWSGYVVPSSTALITDAQGEWTVPTLNCTDTPNGQIAIWVGIGGEQWATGGSSGSLLQTGIQDNCVNGIQQDHAWWEVVPATPNHEQAFTNFPVSPGDVMQADVTQVSSGAWATILTDFNTGFSAYMVTGTSWGVGLTSAPTYTSQGSAALISYAGAYTAEWIVETPTNSSTLGLYPIASFDPVTFTNLRASFTSWQLNQSETWAIVQNGVTLATPTATAVDGFTVGYTGP